MLGLFLIIRSPCLLFGNKKRRSCNWSLSWIRWPFFGINIRFLVGRVASSQYQERGEEVRGKVRSLMSMYVSLGSAAARTGCWHRAYVCLCKHNQHLIWHPTATQVHNVVKLFHFAKLTQCRFHIREKNIKSLPVVWVKVLHYAVAIKGHAYAWQCRVFLYQFPGIFKSCEI
jgi:hypothetical protein